jgi:hypothetical protein
MSARHTPGPLRPVPFRTNPRITCILPVTTDKWDRMIGDAKGLDRLAVSLSSRRGYVDADNHLCAMQRQQAREGYVLAILETNIYGFCVRDTLNDGLGTLHSARWGGGSAEAALDFAIRWHAVAPEKREVILGYVSADRQAELDAAIAKAGGASC